MRCRSHRNPPGSADSLSVPGAESEKVRRTVLGVNLWDTFEGFSRAARWALVASFYLGLALLGVGIGLDITDPPWWTSFPYVQNFVAALTGFLIGVPVALILLTTLENGRIENTELKKLESLSDTAWENFSKNVLAYCEDTRISAYEYAANDELTQTVETIKAGISEYHGTPGYFGPERTDAEYASFVPKLADWASQMEILLTPLDAIPPGAQLAVEWVSVERSWAVLDAYVKVRRFELGLNWLSPDLDTKIQQKLVHESNPCHTFTLYYDPKANFSTIRSIPAYLRYLALMSREEMHRKLHYETPFNSATLYYSEYGTTAAANFLHQLKQYVTAAEQSGGWPFARSVRIVIGDLVRCTNGAWMVRPPRALPARHRLTPGRVLVGHVPCSCRGGHTTWACACDTVVYAPPLASACRVFSGPAAVRRRV